MISKVSQVKGEQQPKKCERNLYEPEEPFADHTSPTPSHVQTEGKTKEGNTSRLEMLFLKLFCHSSSSVH